MYHQENMWWASPYNEKAQVLENAIPKQPVVIHDATLRDGEQTPGVVFSLEDKLLITEKLIEAGVTRIEAGMPAVSRVDFEAVQKIRARFPQAEVYSFSRATRQDIDMAVDCGVMGVVIEIPIGYPKLKYQFNWTWENVLEKSLDCIQYAKEKGLRVVYFPYDTTRACEEDIEKLLTEIMRCSPPDSIGVVDTMGCALPQTIDFMVRWFKRLTNLPIEVHTHNDFGMAVACELAGAAAGAEVLHSCVNGLGERTGNASLEELIVALNILMGMKTQYRLDKLTDLCATVERVSGVSIAPNKPIVGSRNYTRESGIGVNLVMEKPLAMFATNPVIFERSAEIVLGKKSGKASIIYYLDKLGIDASEDQISLILEHVKNFGMKKKRLVAKEEFLEIIHKII